MQERLLPTLKSGSALLRQLTPQLDRIAKCLTAAPSCGLGGAKRDQIDVLGAQIKHARFVAPLAVSLSGVASVGVRSSDVASYAILWKPCVGV